MRFLTILASLLMCARALAAPTIVQHTGANTASGTTCAITLTGVGANDALFFQAYSTAQVNLSSIADSSGNTVSAVEAWTANSLTVSGFGWYYVQGASAGSHTITITLSASSNITCQMSEWSGLATSGLLDTAATLKFVATTTAISTNSITPAQNGELVIFAFGQKGTGNTFSAYNNSFVQHDIFNSPGPSSAWASEVQATAAAISGAATSSTSQNFAAGVAAFVVAGGACPCQTLIGLN